MIDHMIYMDDINLFAKNENELEIFIQTIRIYSHNIRMESGIKNVPS